MKVGIIVHSHTGNTLYVAERLKEELIAQGHFVNLEQVRALQENPSASRNIQLNLIPDITSYDALIFGAPVNGFSLSSVMKAYLKQLPTVKGKKISCFVTQHFPYQWMGGTRSINQIKEICGAKGETIMETGIVNWSHKHREKMIIDVVEKLKNSFN